jgi:hypothetical protein
MFNSLNDQLSGLLKTSIEDLDISLPEYRNAVARYKSVGLFLANYWDEQDADGVVYPQGSMRLGTITKNINRSEEIDIDLVARRDIAVTSITQALLKSDTGHGLDLFVKGDPEGRPILDKGKRCWTLSYGGFHLDILPAVPDTTSSGTGIRITDRQSHEWPYSDPIGYANWFHEVMKDETGTLRKAMTAVMDVPEWFTKTTLQRTVQALKRHRDIYFSSSLDDKPASIIITTLAAQAYRGGGSLYEVLLDIADTMPALVERHNVSYVVSNPVQPKENFADRWNRNERQATRFFEWIEAASRDLRAISAEPGIDQKILKVAGVLGLQAPTIAKRVGLEFRDAVKTGAVAVTSAGSLATGAKIGIPDNNFHGDAHPRG